MAEYEYYLISRFSTIVTVEADSDEEAEVKALDAAPGGLCHSCSDDYESEGEFDIFSVTRDGVPLDLGKGAGE